MFVYKVTQHHQVDSVNIQVKGAAVRAVHWLKLWWRRRFL